MQIDNILVTVNKLESIADLPENGGSRSVQKGFDQSSSYFQSVLTAEADCDIVLQPFEMPIFTVYQSPKVGLVSPTFNYTFLSGTDIKTMSFGGNQTVKIPPTDIFVAKDYGCDLKTDFDGATGKVVLVWYNPQDEVDCTAYNKSLNAFRAGAVAILIANDATRHSLSASRLRGTGYEEGLYEFVQVPTLAISYMAATTLVDLGAKVSFDVSTSITIIKTHNLLCTTRGGDANNLLVFGAHLDSVPAGPGIDDNGSGASMLLEVAKQLKRRSVQLKNKIQFSWWGAEEPGQFGSRYYVNDTIVTKPTEWAKIRAALNFDTIGSPNGAPMVFNVLLKNSGNETFPDSATAGSIAIHDLFTERLKAKGKPYMEAAFEGGSDYSSFIRAGIPTGGLHTGADDVLTVAESKIYGGLPNAVMDPCYHEPCDRVSNLGLDLYATTCDAAAYTIFRLGTQENLLTFLASAGKKTN